MVAIPSTSHCNRSNAPSFHSASLRGDACSGNAGKLHARSSSPKVNGEWCVPSSGLSSVRPVQPQQDSGAKLVFSVVEPQVEVDPIYVAGEPMDPVHGA